MYLSNLAAIVKRKSDSMIAVSVNNRHDYQSNHSYILNQIKCNIIVLLRSSESVCRKVISRIMEETCRVLSIIRPDRKLGRYRNFLSVICRTSDSFIAHWNFPFSSLLYKRTNPSLPSTGS